jgi:hypothetical protein
MKRIIVLICLCLPLTMFAQKKMDKEISTLQFVITEFLLKNDSNTPRGESRKAELILIYLETDSIGKVSNIHLMSDDKNRDKAFDLLSEISVSDFKDWAGSFKKSVIVIPFSSSAVGEGRNSYAETIFGDFFWEEQRPARVVQRKGRVVITNPYIYSSPGSDIIHPPTDKVTPV